MKITVTEKGKIIQNEIFREENHKIILPKLAIKTSGFQSKQHYYIMKPSIKIKSGSKSQVNRLDSIKFNSRKPPAVQLSDICDYRFKSVALNNNNFLPQEDFSFQTLSHSRLNHSKKISSRGADKYSEIPKNKEEENSLNLFIGDYTPEKEEFSASKILNNSKERISVYQSKTNKTTEILHQEYYTQRNTISRTNMTTREMEYQNTLKKAISSTMLMTQHDKFLKNDGNNQFETKISRFCDKYIKDQLEYNSLVKRIRERVEIKKLEDSKKNLNDQNNLIETFRKSKQIFYEINQINDGYKQRKKEKLREHMINRYQKIWKNLQVNKNVPGKALQENKLQKNNFKTHHNEFFVEADITKSDSKFIIDSSIEDNFESKILDF